MDILTRKELETLALHREPGTVSIFMPTHRTGTEVQQGPIRLKNLLDRAEKLLESEGMRAPETRDRVSQARRLLDDGPFWQHQSDGLALFISDDHLMTYRLPLDFEPLVVVADRYHIKPLLPLLSGDGQFYVLALSQNEVRLFYGSRYSVSQVDVEGLPDSLADALWYEQTESQLQLHTGVGAPGGQDAQRATFHGQGVGKNESKDQIRRYFNQIDESITAFLQDEQAPLILAGVDYLLPIYEEANTYLHLVEEGIEGNPETMSAEELHHEAWQIVAPRFTEAQREAAARYRSLSGNDSELASDALETVVPAAHYGRVDVLFVPLGEQRWGTFAPKANALEQHDAFQPGDEDLLDRAAAQTLLHSGTVYAVEPQSIPADDAPIAAILRY